MERGGEMGFLITDATSGVWLADGQGQLLRQLDCHFPSPYRPCASREHLVLACQTSRDALCLHRCQEEKPLLFAALPALGGMCLSPCSRYLYQLSTEADCIHTVHLGTGELCYAVPAGVFPRSMQLSQDGRQLLVAGGAVCEAYLFSAPDLVPTRTFYTRHPCFAAAFWKEGIALLCAGEGDQLHTILYTLSKGVRPKEKLRLPGQPGGLCVCPDGESALISTPDGLMRVCLSTGDLLWNRPEWALCMQMEVQGEQALVSDTLQGCAVLIHLKEPWKQRILLQGKDAQACFCP